MFSGVLKFDLGILTALAILIFLQLISMRMEDENALPGYTPYISGHNYILIRNDILAPWMADPPLLE